MGCTLTAGPATETVAFIETLLPPGVDAVRAGGIEYVEAVKSVEDLPEGVDAARLGPLVYVRTAEK